MVITAICIALPISYFITKHWLDGFAFKIELKWWYFVGAGLTALVIAWLTVGSQAIKAARINPTKHLRNE
jgi:ABC-type antimicrobial peptide transport system permease subunit